jgi:hypothetical protein
VDQVSTAIVAAASALIGVVLGGVLNRRNEKRAETERLLVDALNDAIAAIADVAQTQSREAQARYGSAVGRIALHAPPHVITAFRRFQDDANTIDADGRSRLLTAVQLARHDLGHESADEGDLGVLLFGPRGLPDAEPTRT